MEIQENPVSSESTEKIVAKYDTNPFVFTGELTTTIDLMILRRLKLNGVLVLSFIKDKWFPKDGSCVLMVKEISIKLFGEYNEANATRVRRGIRELIREKVLAYSEDKDIYWVNKAVIWSK